MLNRTLTRLTPALALAGALSALPAAAQTALDDFEGGANQGGWTYGNTIEGIDPTGGNPGGWLHNQLIDTFAPMLRTTVPAAPFHGDWRAMGVSSFGVDLRVVSTQFPYAREATLQLFGPGGAGVYFLGTSLVPQPAEGWKSFDYAVDSASTSMPAGWGVDPSSSVLDPDLAWNTVMQSVTRVQIFFGDPNNFFIFDQWDVGADNARLFTGGPGTSYCVAAPNSTGQGALIAASGSASVAANNLVLSAQPVPAAQSGVFFYGPAQTQVPFGDGFRCVASAGGVGLQRLPVEFEAGGALTHALDNTQPPTLGGQIQPGDTWYFQCWYRDPAAGGATFNLSDALEVVFTP